MQRVIDPNFYAVQMFKNKGYKRAQCRYCKTYFWSVIDRDNCGDAPCADYTFFDIPTKRSLGYREARNIFLEFFKRRGHEIIEPRPVVARWREDLYLTIASIVVFQPHVTSGLVPPPANPLVIAQPCIRLEDIDSVGYTLGRHLTNFTMGGHHAFNYPDKTVYWVNETVELAKDFFVEELGVPEEEITFKESWWEGGGNAGPSFEVAVGGLELATLVFMMYKVDGDNYIELPLKIVDTGYGIERIAWFSRKTPTAFHAVYGDLVREFHKALNVLEPDKEILYSLARKAGRFDLTKAEELANLIRVISRDFGLGEKEIQDQLRNVFDVYAVLDHTKTIALMLADGIVPSNSGEGYLARLVIRRTLRRLSKLESETPLAELVAKQLNFWGDIYPQMIKYRDRILEIILIEEERFKEIISKASTVIEKYLRKSLSTEDLVELYDSHGIPPDIVSQEIEKKRGSRIEIPANFYSLVASRHSKPKTVRELEDVKLPKDVIEWAKKLPPTRRIFHEDPYQKAFKAQVIDVYKNYVVLDASAFYPEGGGQLGDSGYIRTSGNVYKVIDTKKVGDVVVHILENAEGLEKGVEVVGEIDWGIRYRRMRHHTATHIVLGALRKVLGDHIWQAGAEKTEYKARLDVTHYKMPSKEEIEKIENLANSLIDSGLDVNIKYMDRNEAEKTYGFVLYQGGVPMTPIIRVVEIPGWDAEACFGTHVKNTKEVGAIKIINVEKIADGIIRFEFVAGTALTDYAKQIEGKLGKIGALLGSSIEDLDKRVEGIVKYIRTLENTLKSYRTIYENMLIEQIIKGGEPIGNLKMYILKPEIQDEELVKDVIIKAIEKEPRLLLIVLQPRNGKTFVEISLGRESSRHIDAREITKALARKIILRAGGKSDHVTGMAEASINDVETAVKNIIKDLVKS